MEVVSHGRDSRILAAHRRHCVALILAFVLLRPRQRVQLTDSAPVRPHMAQKRPPEGRGLAGEAAAATSDVTGELIGAPVRRNLDGEEGRADDFVP